MPLAQRPKALLFDVFGTCVNWRASVTHALSSCAHDALNSATASLAASVRSKASGMTIGDWGTFAQQWRDSYKQFTRSLAQDPSIPWKSVDEHHLDSLHDLMSAWELDGLWSDEKVRDLSLVWHRLDPWSDTTDGIRQLNALCSTATLSNGGITLLEDLKHYAVMDFEHVLSGELFKSYKPSPKVYLGAVERLRLQPQECAMVAAHLNDLEAARRCGLRTIYIERELEEDWDKEQVEQARLAGWVDLWISCDEKGFISAARRLGQLH